MKTQEENIDNRIHCSYSIALYTSTVLLLHLDGKALVQMVRAGSSWSPWLGWIANASLNREVYVMHVGLVIRYRCILKKTEEGNML